MGSPPGAHLVCASDLSSEREQTCLNRNSSPRRER
nr:MAG TPA: hypothetical protein [Caudoviricetes sp.]